ncbi:xin actin-binding repeat-containing protein 2 isoform X3 [Takifugu rubripes]|uniref:xin actin-binding repeat-containing protein 2 isoform X3 n=1 Tax=Takifugu rubripes TaxID=31033 RepID=UPI0011458A35|nr:xin actin-binding repeat-containing protein 2 isoform X3 [Takifugu rubripes]
MYQAAVSKHADNTVPSGVTEESAVCSLPVGFASVRKLFETQQTANSHSVTQFQLHQTTVQEMSDSEVIVSTRQVLPGSESLDCNQQTTVSYCSNNLESSSDNRQNEADEEFPRYTTKELRAHFERTIEEAAPQKPIKIDRDINRSKWSSNVKQSQTVTNEVCQTTTIESTKATEVEVTDNEDFPPPPPAEDADYLPPPPPDLLQMPESEDVPACQDFPEPPEPLNPFKDPFNREAFCKQRRMNELKRLYKHIQPDISNIEECHTDYDETDSNKLHSCEYIYEDDVVHDDINYDQCEEWEEILPGDVQSMRWIFENKPLDTIRDESRSEEDDEGKITQQEIILGKDVKRTAWMFETKPMDELSTRNISMTEYKNKFNKIDKGDVRAAAWLFETHRMDALNKMHKEEDLTKEILFTENDENSTIYMIDNKCMENLGHTETIDESHLLTLRSVLEEIKGEVKTVTTTFDTQFKCVIMGQSSQLLEIKSVRKTETELENSIASRWLFDTQPLTVTDIGPTPLSLLCSLSMEDSNKGDWGRWLFEIKTLNSLQDLEKPKAENEEVIGADVRKHCLVFETQPMDSLKDDSNARPQTIEDIIGGNVRSARHFFESSPQAEGKTGLEVGKLQKVTLAEEAKGDVRHQKWRFESQPLEHIGEQKKEVIRTVNVEEDLTQEDGTSCRADVRKNCWVFETQPMDTLKDDSNTRPVTKEEIVAGNVSSARHYFETTPAEEIKELVEVGKLKKTVALVEERGDVRHQKWRFESQPLEEIREEKKDIIRTIDLEEIDKVDIQNFKHIFESAESSRGDEPQKIQIEGVTSGSVKSNKNLFESTTLYAMQDHTGHFHEVKTVRREEVVKGDVTTCKWMFETRPIDQFHECIDKYQVIKGISKHQIESGDVKTAKWLFETQPLDSIKYFSNIEDDEAVGTSNNIDIVKGDVKTCKWLFETKPMDILYEKVKLEDEGSEEIQKGDVKTCTWLFETQALDTLHDETETVLKTCTVNQEDIRGKDVKTACFLFETENVSQEETGSFKRVTEIDIASGDVSRMKYIFENQTGDIMTSTSEEVLQKLKNVWTEDAHKGDVVNCKWLFENRHVDGPEESTCNRTVNDVQGGDVDKGRFIFETYSLDEIKSSSETDEELIKMQKIICEEEEKGDVRNYTMMFENQPLYAIQDKAGLYHEVTTVTSEEVIRGDVVGTRWLFETKPLDTIKDTDEVHIIKSVTQEDLQKGDVTSAKWKFETHPLDRIAEEKKILIRTVDDIQGGNVRKNKDHFESDALSQGSVRTVNVSEIQKGDVRTAKWRFETQSIDKIRSMSSENLIETVKTEEVAKGDVKHSVWLFEKNPLDHIKEVDEDEDHRTLTQEEISKADVKTTMWLFETTPFDSFNESKIERTEILGKSVKGTLEELYSQKMVRSKGILIEADEIGDVRMAKYQLMNKQAPEIQREEVIKCDIQTVMMNLLNTQVKQKQHISIDTEEKGNISSTVKQLFNQERCTSIEKEEIIRGDIQEAVKNLFNENDSGKHGILIQEDEMGDVQMTIYSLLNKEENVNVEKQDIVRGDIKSALQKLSGSDKSDQAVKITVDASERGNVNFYSTCIESGSLDYLRQLNLGSEESLQCTAEKEKIIGGDIKSTKLLLGCNRTPIERTVEDVIPGDVHNTVKVFMSEPTLERPHKEEIIKGDLRAALTSLSESANQNVVVEKEEVVKGDIPKALRCLERAHKQYKEVEKPEIVPGNIKGTMRSLEKSSTSKAETVVEDLVQGDVKGMLKSLELAKQGIRDVEREEIIKGDIRIAMQSLQDASSERKSCQQTADIQGDVRGTIQLLMEPPSSPKLQRSSSLEDDVKGDVKMSIRSLYEGQEHTQLEKEEVIKGDVKGTIKSLLETAQRETPKLRAYRRVRVKQSPPVKNLPVDAQRHIQKIKTAKTVETAQKNQSTGGDLLITKAGSEEKSIQQSTTIVEHKTITQNHGVKTLKTEFRNLKSSPKAIIKVNNKSKVQTNIFKAQVQEPDLPLPPPPPPVDDTDLPPPPSVDSDIEQLPPPPPPPPLAGEQDFLPPPPSQQELESMPKQATPPSPVIAKKMTVKKVKGPALHPVPKLEPKVELSKTRHVEHKSEKVEEISWSQSKASDTSRTFSLEFPAPPQSPKPVNKVHVTPVRFTPPPSPPPPMRGPISKFSTPLIKAEEKYRKLKEASTPPTTPVPTTFHDSVSVALEMLSTKEQSSNTSLEQMGANTASLKVLPDSQSSDSTRRVVVANTAGCNISSSKKIITDLTVISSVKQEITSNETSKVVSIKKTSLKSASSGHLSAQPVTAEKDQSFGGDTPKAKAMPKNQKAKTSNKSEDKNYANEISNEKEKPEPIVSSVENVKSTKCESQDISTPELFKNLHTAQQSDKMRADISPKDTQEKASDLTAEAEKTTPNTNGKTGKQNHKGKKTSLQEKQAGIKTTSEHTKMISQDVKTEVMEATEVTVISKSTDITSEPKQDIKAVNVSTAAVCETAAVTERQQEASSPLKKKKKSKKSKGGGQPGQGKESTDSKTDTGAQIHKSVRDEHVQVKKEAINTESKADHSVQKEKAAQKDVKSPQKKKGTHPFQQGEEKQHRENLVTVISTVQSEQSEFPRSTTEGREESSKKHVQILQSDITEITSCSANTGSKSEKALLSKDPHWAISMGSNCEVENSQKHSELLPPEPKLMQLDSNDATEKHEWEKSVSGSPTPRISKISIGSSKIETQTKKIFHDRNREEASRCRSVDLRAPSPSLRMRSPSPTFITIESRRTDSSQRVTPSPTLLHRPSTPPTPPPRRCDTPTTRLTRITPSPTFDRAENLPRLKDATAKLSRGVTPPPPLMPQQISEKKSGIVELPATFHRQIRLDSHLLDAAVTSAETEKAKKSFPGMAQADVNSQHMEKDQADTSEVVIATKIQSRSETPTRVCERDTRDADVSEPSCATVKEKRQFFEEAQKAEINKTYTRKEPTAIPKRLDPDFEKCGEEKKKKEKDELSKVDMLTFANNFESPEGKLDLMKDLMSLTDWLENDAGMVESNKEKADILEQEIQTFDIQAVKNVFELGEQISSHREKKKSEEQPLSDLTGLTEAASKQQSSQETIRPSQKSTSEHVVETVGAENTPAFTERKSVTEHFSNVDEFVKRKTVSRRETCDADATENLLRNFHQTWAESETVFKSLGYTVSEETTSQLVSHQRTTVLSGSSTKVGAVHGMSEESLPDGCSHSGQKKIP